MLPSASSLRLERLRAVVLATELNKTVRGVPNTLSIWGIELWNRGDARYTHSHKLWKTLR